MDSYFPLIIISFLGGSWVFQMRSFSGQFLAARGWSQRFLVLASLAAIVLLASWFVSKKALVISASVEGQFILTVLLTLVAWFFSLRESLSSINIFLIPLVLALWIYLQFFGNWTEQPISFSPWLWLHIVLAICGEVLLIVAALVASAYLLADWTLRQKRFSLFSMRLASLDEFERVLFQTLQWGFFLMTGGFMMGAFFAHHFWDSLWFADPKVVVAVGTWLTYSLILLGRWKMWIVSGRSLAWASLTACVLIIFLALGMDHLVPSRHPFQSSAQTVIP